MKLLLPFLLCLSTIAADPKVGPTSVVPNTRQIVAGSGLLGGGALTADVPLSVDPSGIVPATRTITLNGTANEITSSAGSQTLAGDRVWTFGLASAITLTGKTLTGGTFASPTLTTPFVGSFLNAGHTHQNAAGGGALDTAAIGSGTLAAARMPALTGDVTSSAGTVATTIANLARSKIAVGTANHLVINDVAGNLSSEATLGATRFPALTGDVTSAGGSLATTIANNAVTTAKINNNAVDGTKIAFGSDAQGDVAYYNGTDWARLGAGTSGQFLKTQGAAANPAWSSDISAFATLTDAATITWTVDPTRAIQNGTVTLGGNRTLAFSGTASGMSGILIVKQDSMGNRSLTLPGSSKVISGGSGAITLTTTGNAVDILTWVYDGTSYYWNYGKNYN